MYINHTIILWVKKEFYYYFTTCRYSMVTTNTRKWEYMQYKHIIIKLM